MPNCWQYSLPSNQQLASKPGQQFGHFFAGFTGRLILWRGFAGRERMSESRPLLEGDGGNFQAVNLNGFPRIGQKLRGARRHGVQNDKGRLLGEFHQLGRASDRAKIEDSGSTWDQHQVGRSRCCHCGRFRVRRGVDHDQLGPAIGRGLQALRQTSVRKRDDNRGLTLSAIAPSGGACLGVKVDDSGGKPGRLGGRGKVQGEGGFSSPALLADYGDRFHIAGLAANRIEGKNFCLNALLLAIQQILSAALAPRSLSKAHAAVAAGANVAVLL